MSYLTSCRTTQAQDLRKLGNIRKISKLNGDKAQSPVSLQETPLWQQQSKIKQKWISNFSFPVQYYWISLFCFSILYYSEKMKKYFHYRDTKYFMEKHVINFLIYILFTLLNIHNIRYILYKKMNKTLQELDRPFLSF